MTNNNTGGGAAAAGYTAYGDETGMGEEVDKVCNFCDRYDESFNQDSIDIHYWRECPMLMQCWECEQVIEIAGLNEHLRTECQNRAKYQHCDKCDQVLLKEDFFGHQCIRPQPEGAQKCPLCTTSVYPPNQDGWKQHILFDRCPGNNRAVY